VSGPKKRPQRVADVIASVLAEKGLAGRVEQARVVDEWAALVGPQIAAVTEARLVTSDGVLFVAVKTNAWMAELSLMEPELILRLNREGGGERVRKIRWLMMR
jgi:predicted nucleic acid-binding Zn ribbon protein